MPVVTRNYEPYKDEILEMIRTKITIIEIVRILQSKYNIVVIERILKRYLNLQGINRRIKTEDSSCLRVQIAISFRLGYTDNKILQDLINEGYKIGKTTIARIRKSLGLVKRFIVGDRARLDEALFVILAREVDDG